MSTSMTPPDKYAHAGNIESGTLSTFEAKLSAMMLVTGRTRSGDAVPSMEGWEGAPQVDTEAVAAVPGTRWHLWWTLSQR